MYSNKLERIPKDKSQALLTYLSRADSGDKSHIRRRSAARESDLDEATVQTILSELTSEGILVAELQVRCPYCNTHHGTYKRKSDVPQDRKRCFNCGNEFEVNASRNWEVVYGVADDPEDFFRGANLRLSYYVEEARNLPTEFFRSELEHFREMESPQQRGRDFDYFMGLLFQQLNGVEVRVKEEGTTGEVDVHMVCLDSPEWLHRLVGSHTLIENKWEKDAIQKDEVINFYGKASAIPSCEMAYFVSMSGFSRRGGREVGALSLLKNYSEPSIVDFWAEDVEEMVAEGTPEPLMRDRMMA